MNIVRIIGIERAERVIGHLLRDAAMERLRRDDLNHDDVHEARHLYAALKAGNSGFCERGSCALDREALAEWHRLEQTRYDDPLGLRWTSSVGNLP